MSAKLYDGEKPYDGQLTTGADEDGHVVYTDDLDGFAECISERATGADAADAAELVRRWNVFPALLAACKAALPCLLRDEAFAKHCGSAPSLLSQEAITACAAATAAAEGKP